MVVILVHWLVKLQRRDDFLKLWEEMKVDANSGLYREIISEPDTFIDDAKYHTFSLENPNYKTFINIGFWKSIEHFDNAIGKYIPQTEIVNGKQRIELEDFEFKLRERLVLKVLKSRGKQLPDADLAE